MSEPENEQKYNLKYDTSLCEHIWQAGKSCKNILFPGNPCLLLRLYVPFQRWLICVAGAGWTYYCFAEESSICSILRKNYRLTDVNK